MRDLLKLWAIAVLVIAGWALLSGAVAEVDARAAHCGAARCT